MEGEKKLTVKSKLALIASFVAVFMAASAGFNFVLAWAEPTAPPPANNVAAPINEGEDEQTKTGNLILANYLCFANNDPANCRNAWEDFVGFWQDGAPNGIYYDEGNVGIGTIAPSYARLLLQTDGTVEGLHITRTAPGANAYLNIENETGAPIFKVNQDGKVGVGIAVPEKTLHVYKDFGDNAEIDIQSVAGSGNHWGIYQERVDDVSTANNNEVGDLHFWAGGSNRLRISDDGRMGIGAKIGTDFSTVQKPKVFIYDGGSLMPVLKVTYNGDSLASDSMAAWFVNAGSDSSETRIGVRIDSYDVGLWSQTGNSNSIGVLGINTGDAPNVIGVHGSVQTSPDGVGVKGSCGTAVGIIDNGCTAVLAENTQPEGTAFKALGYKNYFSGKVGIGDETPDEKLEVRDDTAGTARIRITDTTQNPEFQLKYGSLANEHWGIYVDQQHDDLNIWSYNGGSSGNRLTISQNGNVGINESSPSDKLHVAGQVRIDNDNDTANKGCIRYNGVANQLEYSNDCATFSAFGSGGPGVAGNLLEVLQAGSDASSFAGTVKIGNPATDPAVNTTPLDVGGALTAKWIHSTAPGINTFEGDIQFNMTTGIKTIKVAQSIASHGGDLQILAGDAANNIFNSGDGGEILIRGGASTGGTNGRSGKVRIEGGNPLLAGDGGHVEIYGGNGDKVLGAEADGGNVYIFGGGGDEGESGNVYINGGSGGSRGGDIFLNASGTLMGTGIVNVGGISHNTTLKVWGNESITGRLGINTNSPAYRLDVNGQMRLQPSSPPTPVKGVIYFDGTASKFKCSEDGTSFVDCIGSGGTPAALPTGAINQTLRHDGTTWIASSLLYNNDTNIGIGVASPATKLHLLDAASGPIITLAGDSSNYQGIKIANSVGTEQWFSGRNGSNQYVIRQNGATDDVVVNTDGKVGIKTNSPRALLEVSGSVGSGGLGIFGNTNTQATGDFSFAVGNDAKALASNSYAFGQYATASVNNSIVVGLNSTSANRCQSTNPYVMKICGIIEADAFNATGGGDFAEEFSATEQWPAGTVVVMGDDGYKSIKPCNKDYDQSVVGVVSDTVGLLMGKINSDIKVTVGLVGVVKVRVSNINGPIKKGDLLVTSRLTGTAMKDAENRPGTIIGKALEDFNASSGSIMALINLQ